MKESNVFTEKKGKPVFGIDLGTTNSCIAIIKKGNIPEIVTLDDGRRTMPSCVMYNTDGTVTVGVEAYEQRHRTNVVYSVKKRIGSGDALVVKDRGFSRTVTPIEVTAEILKALVKKVKNQYKDVEDVVITVPADFNTVKVDNTIKAAKLAGLNVLQILREPTSAALSLKVESKLDGDILVYDLGGGTFDVSLINISENRGIEDINSIYGGLFNDDSKDKSSIYVVKSTRGDSNLGGDDLDKELLKIVLAKAKTLKFPIHKLNKIEKEKLTLTMEGIKKSGVYRDYLVPLYASYTDNGKKVNKEVEVPIGPQDFAKATLVIFNKTYSFVKEVLKDYNGKIKAIVTVGGSTSNPMIHELLSTSFDVPIYNGLNPDESVALGAAIHAKNIAYGDGDISIMDVLSNGIGILSDNRIQQIIPRDSTVPCSYSRIFGTTRDNQEQVTVNIYSGNSSLKQECDYVGSLVIEDIPEGKAGQVFVKVNLSIDSNGVLSCEVLTASGRKKAEIKNILAGGPVKKLLSIKEKKIVRWRELALSINDVEKSYELNELVDEFESHGTKEQEIIALVRKVKDSIISAPLAQSTETGLQRIEELGYEGASIEFDDSVAE